MEAYGNAVRRNYEETYSEQTDGNAIKCAEGTAQIFFRQTLTSDLVTHMTFDLKSTVAEMGLALKEKAAFPLCPDFYLDGQVLDRNSTLADAQLHDQMTLHVEVPQAIVTTSQDMTARIWSAATCACETTLEGHTGDVLFAAFSPDARMLITCSDDNTAMVWSMSTGRSIRTFKHETAVQAACFSPDCKWAVTGSGDGIAKVWLMKFGTCKHILERHKGSISSIKFIDDGKTIVTSALDGSTKLWNLKTGAYDRTLVGAETVYSVTWSHDGKLYLQTTASGPQFVVRVCDAESGTCERLLEGHANLVLSSAFAPINQDVVVARNAVFPLQV